ncbi:hypothetical protein BD311DRAFT_468501 [Dichomitus squalens]|uniref:Uncharacterized protein n=1 Tax=Dichomitus squalens TaxID=114155 RepID=A0A4Q9MJ46_9APHY|nr:hypothetical protein BD311DRAFT_468501 [Dichomitus squalens]
MIDGPPSTMCIAERLAKLRAYATRARRGEFTCRRAFCIEAGDSFDSHYILCRGSSHTYALHEPGEGETMIYCPPSFTPGHGNGRWLPAFQAKTTHTVAVDVQQDLLVATQYATEASEDRKIHLLKLNYPESSHPDAAAPFLHTSTLYPLEFPTSKGIWGTDMRRLPGMDTRLSTRFCRY